MFRYVIAFLLINTYYSSLGVPVTNISVYLSTLEKNCGSLFLSTQIKSKINECSAVPQNEILKIKCLIFYDINLRLCGAVGSSELVLKDDYSDQLNVEHDVNALCSEAKNWVFTNVTGYSHYKSGVENAFKHQTTCSQVCGMEDLSGNSNYYCKYYKWGLDMLKSLKPTTLTTTTTQVNLPMAAAAILVPNPVSIPTDDKKDMKESNKDSLDLKVKHDPVAPEIKAKETPSKLPLENIEELISGAQVLPDSTKLSLSTSPQTVNDAPINKVEDSSPNANKQQKSPLESGDENTNQDVLNKPPSGLVPNVLESEKDKDPVLDQPNTKEQGNTGLGSDGLDDIHYDGMGDDAEDGTADEKPEEDKKNSAVPVLTSGNKLPVDEIDSLGSNGGYYGSTNQDYSDDDDHFFTFFLVTVMMVVLLYVLYHNKNKVSKVFFGLMLEGRQSGRRRNSRGHAYRRLDTLEQAMSGNTAAPPSKIIY